MADNQTAKNASAQSFTFRATDNSGIYTPHTIISDDDGNSVTFNEDAAHTTGDGGFQLLAVRKDTAAALAGTDGDYIPLIVDDTGRLHVAPQIAANGQQLVKIDDAAFTEGTSAVMPVGGLYAATIDEVDDGDAGALRMTERRGIITTADYERIVASSSNTEPDGAIYGITSAGSSDYDVRDTSGHDVGIRGLDRGWAIQAVLIENTLDQDLTVNFRHADDEFAASSDTLLCSPIVFSSVTGRGGIFAAAEATGAAADTVGVPMLPTVSGIEVSWSCSGTPTTGTVNVIVLRKRA